MSKLDVQLHEKLKNLIASMGYELVGCELLKSRQSVLRIYIDSPKGVSVDDCSKVSYQVSALLDVEDPIQSSYRLEVSSPGIDRPLFELEHYQRHIGKKVKLKLYTAYLGRRQFKGTIIKVDAGCVHLLVDDSEEIVVLPYSEIEKGNLIGEVRFRS